MHCVVRISTAFLTRSSRVPKDQGVSQPVFEAWVLYYSENQYDVERTSFCGLNIMKRYETSTPYVGYRSPTYEQDELRDMTLNAVNGYHAANKRCLPSRLIRGRGKSYEKDLDQRIQKLPRPVQSELNLLLGDRENATFNRFHRRDWTVAMMREEYRYKFATTEHEEVKKGKRFWKKGDKRPIHYFFILRGEDGKVATDDKGMYTATRHGNPWKRVDERERREKQRSRDIRRYGKMYAEDVYYEDRDRDNLMAPPPPMPPTLGRVPVPDFAARRARLDREDTGNSPPLNPFPFGPPRYVENRIAPPCLPPPLPPPPPPGLFSCGPVPPPPRFSCAPPAATYGHSCVCRNNSYPPPPPPPAPPAMHGEALQQRANAFIDHMRTYLPPNPPPSNPPLPHPGSNFPMPPHLSMPGFHSHLHGGHRILAGPGSDRLATGVPFSTIPAEYTGSSRASLPPAPRLSNLTTPTTFSRATSNHTGSSVAGHHAETSSTPASPLPEEDEEEEEEETSSEGGSSRSSRSSSPGLGRRSWRCRSRSRSPVWHRRTGTRESDWFNESAEKH